MAGLLLRRATLEDALDLAPRLRSQDLQEVRSASGRTGLEALAIGVAGSRAAYAVTEIAGPVVFIFGVAPTARRAWGCPWMLASDLVNQHAFQIARGSRDAVDLLHRQGFPILSNSVDARNALHVRWLTWAGFQFLDRVEPGFDGSPFKPFVRIKDV